MPRAAGLDPVATRRPFSIIFATTAGAGRRSLSSSARLLTLLLAVAVLASCATLAPGARPVVVRTEQALSAADVLYREAMAYYFSPGVGPSMSRSTQLIFEKVRTGYDPAYKAVQHSLNAFKLATGDEATLQSKLAALAELLNAARPYLSRPPPPVPATVGGP